MSTLLTVVLIAFYVILAVVAALEKRWPMCLYWVGSVLLTSGVLWMSARAAMEIPK